MIEPWDDSKATSFATPLSERIYSSRLLGSDPTLVLHGGGNTSVKLREQDLLGRDTDVLYVKCSGHDLADIDTDGFTGLRLAALRELAAHTGLSDALIARALRGAALDPDGPPPSVEALLHAVIPDRFVDHTHADAVLALTNTPSGDRYVRDVYGSSVIVVPYVRPGHRLASVCAQLLAAEMTVDTIGLVLLKHGLVSFGASARESYERMIELVARATEYVARYRLDTDAQHVAFASGGSFTPRGPLGLDVAKLRNDISKAAGFPLIVRRDDSSLPLAFANRADVAVVSQSGPATPDHVIYTKRLPMLGRDVDAYAQAYRSYFSEHASADRDDGTTLEMRDPAPRVVLDHELGLCTAGRTFAEAQIAADLYKQTIQLILSAEALESYEALPGAEIFEVEYWAAEQEKLRHGQAGEFAGQSVVVTGAASGIGAACVTEYLARGACVVGLDISEAVRDVANTPCYVGLVCDIAEPETLAAALERCAVTFGGIDMLVLSAGTFPPSKRIEELSVDDWRRTFAVNTDANLCLLRLSYPYLALAPSGGRVVVIASKNVTAPGPGAASYSASKAAVTQLARVAALEWADVGIRVNIIHPNAVFDTGIWTDEAVKARADAYGLTPAEYRTNNVLGVEIRSSDVANLVCAMCGPLFAKITGAQVPIDGGNPRVI